MAGLGGFLMGALRPSLMQPAELLIIAGAATQTLLVANLSQILNAIAGGLDGVLKGSCLGRPRYLDTPHKMCQVLNKVRKEGLLSVENDVEKPEANALFQNDPDFLNDQGACDFVCNTLRMAITGGVEPFDIDQMMALDMEVHHHCATQPASAVWRISLQSLQPAHLDPGQERGRRHSETRTAAGDSGAVTAPLPLTPPTRNIGRLILSARAPQREGAPGCPGRIAFHCCCCCICCSLRAGVSREEPSCALSTSTDQSLGIGVFCSSSGRRSPASTRTAT